MLISGFALLVLGIALVVVGTLGRNGVLDRSRRGLWDVAVLLGYAAMIVGVMLMARASR
jgi:hypothetical protein